ncbi:MAG: TRIC cation channel family protein, partial [Deltaproteobacteria bacterium]|nr:TRIC cation channel family protein [Deltaproteobacteria bacterium]
MQTLIFILDLFGTSVFAVTGSLAAGRKHMDLFG